MKSKKRTVKIALSAILLAVVIALTVVVKMFDPIITQYFSATKIDSATRAQGEALATQIVEEGAVLVRNENNALPLDKNENADINVAVLGWSSTQWVQGGSGSGRSTNNGDLLPHTTFLGALKAADINYDTAITDYYSDFCKNRPFYTSGTGGGALNVHDYEYCRLIEPSVSEIAAYKTKLDAAADKYTTALVVLSRISGESIDCPKAQYKNYTGNGNTASAGKLTGAAVDTTRTYLDISTEEEELLQYAKENFEKVIVLVNNTNTMNLGFLEEYDVDACLIAGGTGNNAVNGVINVLYGEKILETNEQGNVVKYEGEETVYVTPSGKTVDTYVYDFSTNASYAYSAMEGVSLYDGLTTSMGIYPYDGKTTNGNVNATSAGERYPGVSYLDYVEGIYVGYKWYETADAEGFWTSSFAKSHWNKYGTNTPIEGYNDVVQYPFGYGLSYTEFEWDATWMPESNGTITVIVDVTNVGDRPGQDVVELYYTPPYNANNGIEKAEVNLVAFAKTQILPTQKDDPDNCTQTLTFNIDIQDMASYSEKANNGQGAYVLESGSYKLSLRTDAHTLATVKGMGATNNYNLGNKTYTSYENGSNGTEAIHNLFGANSSDGVAVDGSDSNQNITWLSRKNFSATFLYEKEDARQWQDALKDANLFENDDAQLWEEAHATDETFNENVDSGLRVADSKGKITDEGLEYGNPENFDNEDMWNALLDQLNVSDMLALALHGYVHEEPLSKIGKPQTSSYDGPSQIGSFNAATGTQGVGYPMPTVLAQSWNAELSKSFGLAVGNETRASNRDGWYAPGANLHRSAFGGRNYEYYSEDSYLSGVMCANTVRGALNAGTYTYIKHVIGYDQESNRDGLYCWMTEQALRETYLRPFKMAVDQGATGLMSSYGRLGAMWSGGSTALLTDLLRNEWGFKGTVLTDYSDHQEFMNGDQMVRAGGDIWMDGYMSDGKFRLSTSSNAFKKQLREAAKHVVYTYCNAAYESEEYAKYVAENGDGITFEKRDNSHKVFKWWWLIVGVVDALCVGGAAVLLITAFKKPKNEAPDVAEATADTVAPGEPS